MATMLARKCVPLSLFVLAISLAPHLIAKDRDPVLIKATITPINNNASHFTVAIELDIQDGWHVYDEVPEGNPSPITEVSLNLPDGVTSIGDWKRPVGLPYDKDPTTQIFTGKISFTHEIKAAPSNDQREIGVNVDYQVCNDRFCFPPAKFETTVALAATASQRQAKASGRQTFTNKYFEAPVRLMVGEQPLNRAAKQMYPSPAMFDIDNDGHVELVVGDIFGTLNVYENKNVSGKGDPIWSSHTPLKTAKGKKIKVSNW